MFDIYTYINTSDNMVVDKNLIEIIKLQGDFRYENSIINPVIDVEASNNFEFESQLSYDDNDNDNEYDVAYTIGSDEYDISYTLVGNVTSINYIYIPLFNRYYYVDDVIIVNNNLFRFVCSIDCRLTYREQYRKLYAVVERNQYQWNTEIEDTLQPFKFKYNITETDIDTSDADIIFNPNINKEKQYDTICTCSIKYLGGASVSDAIISVNNPEDNLPKVCNFQLGLGEDKTHIDAMRGYYISKLISRLFSDENLATYVLSLMIYPFELTTRNSNEYPLILGTTTINDVKTRELENEGVGRYYKIGSIYIQSLSNYLDYEPYTKYELYLPYFGYVELKSNDILNCLINIYYVINYAVGTATIIIYNHTKQYTIKTYNTKIGVEIAVSKSNQQQLRDEQTQLAIKSSISGLGSVASILGGAVTYNPFLVASGVTGLVGTATDIISTLNQQHERVTSYINSGYEGCFNIQKPRLKITKMIKQDIEQYTEFFGHPVNMTFLLDDIHGYTKIADIHLDNLECTNNEKNILLANLKEGIIL